MDNQDNQGDETEELHQDVDQDVDQDLFDIENQIDPMLNPSFDFTDFSQGQDQVDYDVMPDLQDMEDNPEVEVKVNETDKCGR